MQIVSLVLFQQCWLQTTQERCVNVSSYLNKAWKLYNIFFQVYILIACTEISAMIFQRALPTLLRYREGPSDCYSFHTPYCILPFSQASKSQVGYMYDYRNATFYISLHLSIKKNFTKQYPSRSSALITMVKLLFHRFSYNCSINGQLKALVVTKQ